ncbi:hypothetical protein HPB47_004251, partial [Ixodes persulcatus]
MGKECRLLSPSALVVCFCTDAELTPEPVQDFEELDSERKSSTLKKEQLLQDVADLAREFGYKFKPVPRKATATEEGATTTSTATLEPPERATVTTTRPTLARPATNRAARDAATTARVVAAAAAYRPVNHNAAARQSSPENCQFLIVQIMNGVEDADAWQPGNTDQVVQLVPAPVPLVQPTSPPVQARVPLTSVAQPRTLVVQATRQKRYREHLGSLEKRAEEDRSIKKLVIALEERRLAMEERQIEEHLAIEERQKRPNHLQHKYGFFSEPVDASRKTEWTSQVRKRVRDYETQKWLRDAQTKSTLEVYLANKMTIASEVRVYDNSWGSRFLFEARAGALRTLSYRRRFDTTVTSTTCRVCGVNDETVEHIVLDRARRKPSRSQDNGPRLSKPLALAEALGFTGSEIGQLTAVCPATGLK